MAVVSSPHHAVPSRASSQVAPSYSVPLSSAFDLFDVMESPDFCPEVFEAVGPLLAVPFVPFFAPASGVVFETSVLGDGVVLLEHATTENKPIAQAAMTAIVNPRM